MTERTLVQAAQAGRPEAADELVERYYSRVYSFVSSYRSGDAEDITQEVFARALVALPRFNGEYQFGAWLLQIARNICIDEARRQVHRPQPTDPVDLAELEPVVSKPDDVWESVASQLAVTTVHRAMAKLPQRMRTALVLRELEGMSYADIAIALRISTRAVEISLARARKRLRLELQRIDVAEEELATCRRAAALLESPHAGSAGVSDEDVAAHVRGCSICQAMARKRRPWDAARALVGPIVVGSSHAGQLVRRQAGCAHLLLHRLVNAPATAAVSPMSRLAEIGASLAMATVVSAGSFAAPAAPRAPVVNPPQVRLFSPPPPVVAPRVVPPAVVPPSVTVAPTAAKPEVPVSTTKSAETIPCGAGTDSASTGSGNSIAQLLTPVNNLSPVLACNTTLADLNTALANVGTGVNALLGSLLQPAASPAVQPNVGPLLGLLGASAPPPAAH